MSWKSIAAWLVVFAVVSPFLAYGGSQFVPGYSGFIVESGSMEPEIMTGAILYTKNVSAEKISEGDTITYQDGDKFTTHEVIGKNSSDGQITFKTKGVANEAPDPGRVTEDQLAGKKITSIPFLGYMVSWAGTDEGIAVLILLPATLMIGSELRLIIREVRSRKEE